MVSHSLPSKDEICIFLSSWKEILKSITKISSKGRGLPFPFFNKNIWLSYLFPPMQNLEQRKKRWHSYWNSLKSEATCFIMHISRNFLKFDLTNDEITWRIVLIPIDIASGSYMIYKEVSLSCVPFLSRTHPGRWQEKRMHDSFKIWCRREIQKGILKKTFCTTLTVNRRFLFPLKFWCKRFFLQDEWLALFGTAWHIL